MQECEGSLLESYPEVYVAGQRMETQAEFHRTILEGDEWRFRYVDSSGVLVAEMIIWNTILRSFQEWASDDLTVILPEGITSLYGYAFKGARHLVRISLPKSLEEIRMNAFENCVRLKTVEGLASTSVEVISPFCFSHCTSLKQIEVPSCLEAMFNTSFAYCRNLNEIKSHSTYDVRFDSEISFFDEEWITQREIQDHLKEVALSAQYACKVPVFEVLRKNVHVTAWDFPLKTVDLFIPDTVKSVEVGVLGPVENVHCSQKTVAAILRSLQASAVFPQVPDVIVRMNDGREIFLPGTNLSQAMRDVLGRALSTDWESVYRRAVDCICEGQKKNDRCWLLFCLSEQCLRGETKKKAMDTVMIRVDTMAQKFYENGRKDRAVRLVRAGLLSVETLDRFLEMANQEGDIEFAAQILDAKATKAGNTNRQSYFPL